MKNTFVLLLVTSLLFMLASSAQSSQKMVINFHSEGSMMTRAFVSPSGPAGVEYKAEGFVYLHPKPN
jgi:hypothetical protein